MCTNQYPSLQIPPLFGHPASLLNRTRYCERYCFPSTTLDCNIYHRIVCMAISCKGQTADGRLAGYLEGAHRTDIGWGHTDEIPGGATQTRYRRGALRRDIERGHSVDIPEWGTQTRYRRGALRRDTGGGHSRTDMRIMHMSICVDLDLETDIEVHVCVRAHVRVCGRVNPPGCVCDCTHLHVPIVGRGKQLGVPADNKQNKGFRVNPNHPPPERPRLHSKQEGIPPP